MKLQLNNYKERKVCPLCFSLSFKKSYKFFKCDNCEQQFKDYLKVKLMHKGLRCIDNDVSTRKERYNKVDGVIYYE